MSFPLCNTLPPPPPPPNKVSKGWIIPRQLSMKYSPVSISTVDVTESFKHYLSSVYNY